MKRQSIIRLASFFVVISLALWGCAKESSDDVPSAYDSNSGMLDEGWDAYRAGGIENFETALELFQAVGRRDALSTNAYLGQGWSSLRLESYIDARTAFGVVLNLAANEGDNASMADGWAGLFLIELMERYNLETDPDEDPTEDDLIAAAEEAVEAGEAVLTYDAAYTTTHDADFDYLEVHKALAQTYLYLHRYEETLEHTASYVESTVNDLLGSFTDESTADTLGAVGIVAPYADKNGNLQVFVLDEDLGTPTTADLPGNILTLETLADLNGDSTTDILDDIVNYLYEDNLVYFTGDYDYPSATEILPVYKVQHAQPEAAAASYLVVKTSMKGCYSVSSATRTVEEDSVTWFIVDITQTPPDTAVADDVYTPGPCCYFFSDTTEIEVQMDVNPSVWTSLDPLENVPTDPLSTLVGPDSTQLTYDYDMIVLDNDLMPSTSLDSLLQEGLYVTVSYNYAKYLLKYKKTDDFVAYLAYLNSKLSVGNSKFLVER